MKKVLGSVGEKLNLIVYYNMTRMKNVKVCPCNDFNSSAQITNSSPERTIFHFYVT